MVAALLEPLNLIIAGLAAGFLLPLIGQWRRGAAKGLFVLTLAYMAGLALHGLLGAAGGAPALDIQTAGIAPPFAINLRFGLEEAFFVGAVNLAGLFGGWYLLARLGERAGSLALFVVLVMGIDGMIMTRDLFNLFIFIEITGIATYGLLALAGTGNSLVAGFKYVIATSIASTFFLLGTVFLYQLTGTLNIDGLVRHAGLIVGPVATVASAMLLTGVLIELKPYPANGWGLDVYETAPPGIAAMVSVGVSAGAFFALYKVLPLLGDLLPVVAGVGGATFLVSNLIGLRQSNARRLLGYSSIAQMALMSAALAILLQTGKTQAIPWILGGLFINHLLAKAGLFWLAGALGRDQTRDWSVLSGHPIHLIGFALLIVALVGLPPFPGFWAKWELIMQLSDSGLSLWVVLVLVGSLLEAVYLFRWLGHALGAPTSAPLTIESRTSTWAPIAAFCAVLAAGGYYMAEARGFDMVWSLAPLYAAVVLFAIDALPGRVKGLLLLAGLGAYGYLTIPGLQGLAWLFALMLVGGGALISIASLRRGGAQRGYYPLLAMLLLSLGELVRAQTSLQFFFAWELMTISSYFLIARGREAGPQLLAYLAFSLASAFLLLAGFGLAYADTGSTLLAALGRVDAHAPWVLGLLAAGFVIKVGGLGVHIWLPGAYAEAEDDFTAVLSAVVSKGAIFGLLLAALHLGLKSGAVHAVLYVLGWVGLLTALWGALMALFQEDVKRLLAYSSMGQVGYIVAAAAVMSQLGWVASIYLAVNHLLFKGLLFLAVAGVIHRTGTRLMYKMGGLITNMPLSFVSVLVGIIAISGVPPLSGFGGKWLLFNALMDKGWYLQAALAFFAGAVAFLYLFRLIHTVFLGQRKLEHKDLKEASWITFVPQFALIGCIMVLSVYPRLLTDLASNMVAGILPAGLKWSGTLAESHLGYWDPMMIMGIVAGVFMVPLAVLLFMSLFMHIQRVKQFNIVFAAERPDRPETTHYAYNFYAFYDRALGFLVRPRATAFWDGVSEWIQTFAGALRVFYTGNGQTYALFVMAYLAAIYFMAGEVS